MCLGLRELQSAEVEQSAHAVLKTFMRKAGGRQLRGGSVFKLGLVGIL